VPVGYLTISNKGMILEANLTAAVMLGVAREHLIMQPFSAFILPEDQDIYYRCRKELSDLKTTQERELSLVKKDGSPFPALMKFSLYTELEITPGQFRIVITDITERKKIEAEREKLIVELQKALTEIKTLQGLIPMCMICKNIKNDKGAWDQLEVYIMDHSDAKFTHGLCPICLQKELKKIDQTKED
jgi:PAS domain S-box-containing protein